MWGGRTVVVAAVAYVVQHEEREGRTDAAMDAAGAEVLNSGGWVVNAKEDDARR